MDGWSRQIDKCRAKWVERLAESVAIASVSPSTDREHRQEVFRMIDWTEKVGQGSGGDRGQTV